MRSKTTRFIARIAAVVGALCCILLLEALLAGTIGLLAGLMLLPGTAYATAMCADMGLRKIRKPRRAHRPVQAQNAPAPLPAAPARLRVVEGGKHGDKKPPHVA